MMTREEWYKVLAYIYYLRSIGDGTVDGVSVAFDDVDRLRDENPKVDQYITDSLQLHALELKSKKLDEDRLKLNRRLITLQKEFIEGFDDAGGIFNGKT